MWFANSRRPRLAATLLTLGLLAWPSASTVVADSSPSFSGQATVVQAKVAGTAILLADTGALPPSGGAQEASLLNVKVPSVLSAEVLHASTVGQGSSSRAEASVATASLTVGDNAVAADFLMARASATCSSGGASTSGSGEIVGLTVNGKSVAVSGSPNQTVSLPGGGKVIINEQNTTPSSGSITVNALHVIIPPSVAGIPGSDVIISSAHADISNCPSPGQSVCGNGDFVTGGGWIAPNGSHDNFGVAGGMKNGALWGHLEYHDHATGLSAHGTGVTVYQPGTTGPTSRHIEGTAEINGQGGFYKVDVADNGEPGVGSDTFAIVLSVGGYSASGTLDGGNIKLHAPC